MEKFTMESLLNEIKPNVWFDVKNINVIGNASNARARLQGVKEFRVRRVPRPAPSKVEATEFYITAYDLKDVKSRINTSGSIDSTRCPKQKITYNELTEADKLYNRFLGVAC